MRVIFWNVVSCQVKIFRFFRVYTFLSVLYTISSIIVHPYAFSTTSRSRHEINDRHSTRKPPRRMGPGMEGTKGLGRMKHLPARVMLFLFSVFLTLDLMAQLCLRLHYCMDRLPFLPTSQALWAARWYTHSSRYQLRTQCINLLNRVQLRLSLQHTLKASTLIDASASLNTLLHYLEQCRRSFIVSHRVSTPPTNRSSSSV